jgi:hypothetical protein
MSELKTKKQRTKNKKLTCALANDNKKKCNQEEQRRRLSVAKGMLSEPAFT